MKKLSLLLILLLLKICAYAQPPNDSICNASPISISLGCTEGTNVGATISETAFSPSCWGGSAISNDVWYKFVATVPGMTVSTDVQGLSLINTQVAVYSSNDNTCTGVLTQAGCDDNSGTNQANNSIINMASLVPGNTYFIRVDGSGAATGTFCINVSDTYVPGSTPCEAQLVHPNNLSCIPASSNTSDNGNNLSNAISPVGYYRPLGVDYCGGDDETNQYGTWSTFTANSASITIENQVTDARDYTLFSSVSGSCTNLTCVSGYSVTASGAVSISGLAIGQKYFILTTLRNGLTTTGFRTDMCVKNTVGCTPPANDNCADAQSIVANQLYVVTTYCAEADSPPALCSGTTQNNIWFSWPVPSDWTGDAFFQLYQQNCTGGDQASGSQVSVYAPGISCGGTSDCAGGTTSDTQTDNNITAVWTPIPGSTYLISYDGTGGEVCSMRFQITNKASTDDISVNSMEICPGQTAVLTASGGGSYLWDNGETTNSITINPTITTSYNVTSTSGKIGSAVGFVIVKPIPSLTSDLSPIACSGKTFAYPATSSTSGTTYKWKRALVAGISNAAASGTGSSSEVLTNTTINEVDTKYVYVSTANGCTNGPAGDTVVVTVTPVASIPNQTATICSGQIFNIVPKNGVPTVATKVPAGTIYTWSAPSISPASTITGDSATTIGKDTISQTLTNLTYSLSTVTYTVTPWIDGCSQTPFLATVTVRASDNPSFSYALSTYCQNDNTADTTAHLTGLPGGVFKSTPGLVINAATGKFDLVASTLGTYTVTYVTNGTCIDSSAVTVTITLAPDAHFSYDTTAYCQQTANPSPTYPVGASAGVFTFNPTGLVLVSDQTGEIDLLTSASGTYTVTNTIAAAGTCLATSHNYTVKINPAPVMTNTVTSTTICSGTTLNLALSASVTSKLKWFANDNPNITGESITNKTTVTINDIIINHSLVQEALVYSVTPTSHPQGCVGTTQTINVIVNPKPVVTSSGTALSICSGTTISIPLATDIATTINWMTTPNANITGESITPQTTFTLSNTLTNTSTSAQTLTYSVTPTSTLGACVGSSHLISVKVNPIPVLNNINYVDCKSGNFHLYLDSNRQRKNKRREHYIAGYTNNR